MDFSVEFECTSTTNFVEHDQVAVQICLSFMQNQNLLFSDIPLLIPFLILLYLVTLY